MAQHKVVVIDRVVMEEDYGGEEKKARVNSSEDQIVKTEKHLERMFMQKS